MTATLLLSAFLLPLAVAKTDAPWVQTERYLGLTDRYVTTADQLVQHPLLCDEAALGFGVGGACFDVPAGARTVAFVGAQDTGFGLPALSLAHVDAAGTVLRLDRTCLDGRERSVEHGGVTILAIPFQATPQSGCDPSGDEVQGKVGPVGFGTLTATFG